MKIYILLLFVGIVTTMTQNLCNGYVHAIKCCASDEQLNTNLTMCQKRNATSAENNAIFNETTSISVFNIENSTTSAEYNDPELNEFEWIPEPLRVQLTGNDILSSGGQNNCDVRRTVRLQYPRDAHRIIWVPNGSLVLQSPTALGKNESRIFDPEEFCTDTFTDNNGTQQNAVLLCPCHRIRCLKKCCLLGQAMVCKDKICDCGSHDMEWIPFFRDFALEEEDFSFEIVTYYVNFTCTEGYQDLVYVLDAFPQFLRQRFWEWMLMDRGREICGDTIVGATDTPQEGMVKCNPKKPFEQEYALVNWLHVPEAALLGVALLGAFVEPRRRRRRTAHARAHDLALAWHAVALLARCLLWAVYLRHKWSCAILPIFIYFFSIAASFWLNVLCINMAFGFWRPLGAQDDGAGGRAGAMLLLYSAYAWGAAGVLTALTAAMWLAPRIPPGLLRPTLQETRTCFREEESDGKLATFAYYYGPVGGLLCVNALLFAATALRVRQLSDSSAILKTADGKHAFSNKRSVVIYIKLLWLMGVMEMAVEMAVEAVAWLSNSNEYYFALAASCLDLLRAVAIFVLCCCKRRTLVALRDRALGACAAAKALWPWRPCCPGRRPQERDLRASGGIGSASSDASVNTEVTDTDGAVGECKM